MLAEAMIGSGNRALEAAAELVEDLGKQRIIDPAIVAAAIRMLKGTVEDLLKRDQKIRRKGGGA